MAGDLRIKLDTKEEGLRQAEARAAVAPSPEEKREQSADTPPAREWRVGDYVEFTWRDDERLCGVVDELDVQCEGDIRIHVIVSEHRGCFVLPADLRPWQPQRGDVYWSSCLTEMGGPFTAEDDDVATILGKQYVRKNTHPTRAAAEAAIAKRKELAGPPVAPDDRDAGNRRGLIAAPNSAGAITEGESVTPTTPEASGGACVCGGRANPVEGWCLHCGMRYRPQASDAQPVAVTTLELTALCQECEAAMRIKLGEVVTCQQCDAIWQTHLIDASTFSWERLDAQPQAADAPKQDAPLWCSACRQVFMGTAAADTVTLHYDCQWENEGTPIADAWRDSKSGHELLAMLKACGWAWESWPVYKEMMVRLWALAPPPPSDGNSLTDFTNGDVKDTITQWQDAAVEARAASLRTGHGFVESEPSVWLTTHAWECAQWVEAARAEVDAEAAEIIRRHCAAPKAAGEVSL